MSFTDNLPQIKPIPVPIMSRKRTRSRSEDSIVVPTKIQPLNVVSQLRIGCEGVFADFSHWAV